MSLLLVLVAHDGKTLQLDVTGSTRVDAMQQALAGATGVAVADQIVMAAGARLDPAKPLAAYGLPPADPAAAETSPVFLYHKAFLRPGAPPPPLEPLPLLEVAVPARPALPLARHPLSAAHSPLVRALPDYEAQFQQQLGEAAAFYEATQARLHRARRLMSEQEVQARAADAARANVESHYNYIAGLYGAFVDRYAAQHRRHSALLERFGELCAALGAVQLPPQLASGPGGGGGPEWRTLADLQPRGGAALDEYRAAAARGAAAFAAKVAELEALFGALRLDVEALFLQAPRVDLDALGLQLREAEGLGDEQAIAVQVLQKDLSAVQALVEDVVAQLGGSAGGAGLPGAAVHDAAAAMDALNEGHVGHVLPRVRAADAAAAEFLGRCAEAKALMAADVFGQLQRIAAQQSRIRDLKHRLGVFGEVLARQELVFRELRAAARVPAAYRLALAECVRRAAWHEMFAAQAARLAEHCGRVTAKEAAKRGAVRAQLEHYLPGELLARAGLLGEPPHCSVSLPPVEASLLRVTPAEVAALPAVIAAAAEAASSEPQTPREGTPPAAGGPSSSMAASLLQQQQQQHGASTSGSSALPQQAAVGQRAHPPSPGVAAPRTSVSASTVVAMGASAAWGYGPGAGAGPSSRPSDPAAPQPLLSAEALALENARLRAELAAHLAAAAAAELRDGDDSSDEATAAKAPPSSSLSASVAAAEPAAADAAAAASAGPTAAPAFGRSGVPVVPASVAAPLPSVAAALERLSLTEGGAAAAAAARRALALAPVRAALAAKDELATALEARCRALQATAAARDARIAELEAALSSSARGGPNAPPSALAALLASTCAESDGGGCDADAAAGAAEAPPSPAAAAAAAGAQSVAPAFALDDTQAPSFFGQGTAEPKESTQQQQQQQQQQG